MSQRLDRWKIILLFHTCDSFLSDINDASSAALIVVIIIIIIIIINYHINQLIISQFTIKIKVPVALIN